MKKIFPTVNTNDPSINLTRTMRKLYKENYKVLLKYVKYDKLFKILYFLDSSIFLSQYFSKFMFHNTYLKAQHIYFCKYETIKPNSSGRIKYKSS